MAPMRRSVHVGPVWPSAADVYLVDTVSVRPSTDADAM